MRAWHFGNTTVRSPFRLRDGLVVLSTSSLQGNLHGEEQELAFIDLLVETEIVKPGKSKDKTYSVGRKWRAALSQLGFLNPEIPKKCSISQSEIGQVDMITPSGWRLIRSESVSAMQECFLRSLAAYYIPSPIKKKFSFSMFSPLRHILKIMLKLDKMCGDSRLNFIEMALIAQLTSSDDNLDKIVDDILTLRLKKDKAISKRKFDGEQRKIFNKIHGYTGTTLNDYADTNIRYLKATGLVQNKGRGITLVPEKHVFIEKLIQDTGVPDSDRAYFITLCNGATLPTDSKDPALAVLNDLLQQLRVRGIPFDTSGKSTNTPADIAIIRHQIEDLLSALNEEEYAGRQARLWEEIAAYMELIIDKRGKMTLLNGEEIEVPQSEAPAYFEWILWRAFLAINKLANKPYEARRFKIDQDFLPICTAPGNGPDMEFEFEDFVLIVEVTLTTSSRQEAAEGETVRRHVAEKVRQYYPGKPVYGLFVANRIDSNTAETFRIGSWYTKDDQQMHLNIVPFTLEQFKNIFIALFKSKRVDNLLIRDLLDKCNDYRIHAAPVWKHKIESVIKKQITLLHN